MVSDDPSLPDASQHIRTRYLRADKASAIEARLLELYEAESVHLREMDKRQLMLARRGQLFGFIVALAFLLTSFVLVALGHAVAGTIIGSVDLVALTGIFVTGNRNYAPRSSRPAGLGGDPSQSYETVVAQQAKLLSELSERFERDGASDYAEDEGKRDGAPRSDPPVESVPEDVTQDQSDGPITETGLSEEDHQLWHRVAGGAAEATPMPHEDGGGPRI